MNERKASRALSNADVKMIINGWQHAKFIGLPLNVLITARPQNMDRLEHWQRCALIQRTMNIYGQFARRHEFRQAAIYTRECAPDNTGEHFHILCHAPLRLRDRLKDNAATWFPGPGETHSRNADYLDHWRGEKVGNAALYIAKQMSAQAHYGRPFQWKAGGTIIGARWGCTRNVVCELSSDGHGWTYSRWRASNQAMIQSFRKAG